MLFSADVMITCAIARPRHAHERLLITPVSDYFMFTIAFEEAPRSMLEYAQAGDVIFDDDNYFSFRFHEVGTITMTALAYQLSNSRIISATIHISKPRCGHDDGRSAAFTLTQQATFP